MVVLRSGLRMSCGSTAVTDKPCVIMLPGPTDSWRSYEAILDRLPASTRGIAVSLRGHGDSDKPVAGYSVQDFADDVVALLDALAIDRAVFAAHSGACMHARRVALDHPDRVSGLVLEASPMTLVGNAALDEFVTAMLSGLKNPSDADFARQWVDDTSSADSGDRPDMELLVTEVLKVPAHVWKETFGGLLTYDDTSELSRLSVRTLLIWGDADQIVTQAAQQALLEAITGARLTVYTGAGHAPRWDQRERFAEELASFAVDCSS